MPKNKLSIMLHEKVGQIESSTETDKKFIEVLRNIINKSISKQNPESLPLLIDALIAVYESSSEDKKEQYVQDAKKYFITLPPNLTKNIQALVDTAECNEKIVNYLPIGANLRKILKKVVYDKDLKGALSTLMPSIDSKQDDRPKSDSTVISELVKSNTSPFTTVLSLMVMTSLTASTFIAPGLIAPILCIYLLGSNASKAKALLNDPYSSNSPYNHCIDYKTIVDLVGITNAHAHGNTDYLKSHGFNSLSEANTYLEKQIPSLLSSLQTDPEIAKMHREAQELGKKLEQDALLETSNSTVSTPSKKKEVSATPRL